ncbi:hypothetical protein [Streptomyces sp. NPDC090994]|uniref:hypothetical protein n=1 Tax=Streptomyces sp. NPDC090994 TaxID=3365969 RepID=UPI0037FD9618
MPDVTELVDRVRNFQLRVAVLSQKTETALDATRDRYGRTILRHEAHSALTRRTEKALESYAEYLDQHATPLLDVAHSALEALPPARHVTAWRDLLNALATSHAQIRRVLNRPAGPDTAAAREQQTDVWPHLALWAEYGDTAASLADQHHQPGPQMTNEEQQLWTGLAQAARRRGELDLVESWYAADGRLITWAYLVEDDTSTIVALAGDPDAPGWEVIGHFDTEAAAGQALPRAVPPGVLRADASSRFNRPEPAPERPLRELIREVVEARTAGEVAEALHSAAQAGHGAGPLVRLKELLDTASEYSSALGTVQGQRTGARLAALGRQLDSLTDEVTDAADDLGATVGVLPPHRVTAPPRIRSRPVVNTTPPAPPARTTAPAHRP